MHLTTPNLEDYFLHVQDLFFSLGCIPIYFFIIYFFPIENQNYKNLLYGDKVLSCTKKRDTRVAHSRPMATLNI